VKNRRGPWLSGLIVALIGAVWMSGQVIGGVVSMITDMLSVISPMGLRYRRAWSAPPADLGRPTLTLRLLSEATTVTSVSDATPVGREGT
jgi:hypothetical protein